MAEGMGRTVTSSAETAAAVGRRVRDVLDPALAPYGFLTGQVGLGDDVEITFCCPGHEFSGRFPHLASWMDLDHPAACVDLTVYAHPLPPRLTRVWLEGRELDELVGGAVPGADGVGLPLEEGLERLARTLTTVLLRGSPHE